MANMGKRKSGAQASYIPGAAYQAPVNTSKKGSSKVMSGESYVHGKGPGSLRQNTGIAKVNKHTTQVDTNSPKSNAGHGKRPW